MTEEVNERFDRIEEKLDACLVLLKKATSHDTFRYFLHDKSEGWIMAMRGADLLASRVTLSSANRHQADGPECSQRSLEPQSGSTVCDRFPTETAA